MMKCPFSEHIRSACLPCWFFRWNGPMKFSVTSKNGYQPPISRYPSFCTFGSLTTQAFFTRYASPLWVFLNFQGYPIDMKIVCLSICFRLFMWPGIRPWHGTLDWNYMGESLQLYSWVFAYFNFLRRTVLIVLFTNTLFILWNSKILTIYGGFFDVRTLVKIYVLPYKSRISLLIPLIYAFWLADISGTQFYWMIRNWQNDTNKLLCNCHNDTNKLHKEIVQSDWTVIFERIRQVIWEFS